ncbi:MAG TPA: PLP-dependent aminotransferase family protein [Tahibacter sp.]|uniref:aminotransferase-like domain-containing protein n=1 Tax=Tahibacter sp. TaxID=2056211 RepID=UPI002B83167A|nr:PLP-dependent aminotransferase family protein [Tahibacter sp.]HSX59008.1 PLP-dependent aminotransferase family protein [Tahibacter sp.]
MKLYERYAAEIAALIEDGQLAPGDRLPSVREARARRGVSASTVFQAYQKLEREGLIQARPQSGFYVAATSAARMPDVPVAAPGGEAGEVTVSDLVFAVLGAARSGHAAPLGSAFPGPDLFPLAQLAKAAAKGLRRLAPETIVENLAPGNPRLREQIALRYRIDGIRLRPDEIVVTNGALEALNAALQAVTQPGDTVAIESPAFYAALQAIERLKLKALQIRTDPEHGIDVDALADALSRTRIAACWLMPTFQNPLGCLMPEARKRVLVALLARHAVPLIEDDVYGELYFGSQRPRPAKAYDEAGLVLHCSSFSKCLAPGYRVGWIAAGREAQRIQRLVLMTTMAASVPAQTAVLHYLEDGGYDRHLRRLRASLAARMNAAMQVVETAFPPGSRLTRPRGGYFLWLALPAGLDAMRLHEAALRNGIGFAPGHIFSPDLRFSDCLRINCGHAADAVLPALRRLGALAHELTRSTA